MSKDKYTDHIDFDGKWKALIEELFEEFVEFFLPELYSSVDFSHPAKFLKQELTEIMGSPNKKGEMTTDNLIEVRFKNGKNRYVLIHIEVHGYENVDFGEKMFRYLCRIYDKHPHEITTLAILIADRLPKNYQHFRHKLGRTEISYKFPVYIIRNQDEAALLRDGNPFALAVLACQHIYQTRKQYNQRMILKSQLFSLIWKRYFFEQETSRAVAVAIASFVNNLIQLPLPLEKQYQSQSITTIMYDLKVIEKKKQEPHFQFVNKLFEATYGKSAEELLERVIRTENDLTEAERLLEKSRQKIKETEAKRKAEEQKRKAVEQERKKEEQKRKAVERERKQQEATARQQQIDTIRLLHRLQQSAEQISTELKFDLDFVKKVLDKETE